MFIEHRTYTVKPGRVAEYLDDYGKNGWAAHSAHTPCLGHYYTEAGELFRVVSLWRYESFEDRLARRAALAAQPGWRDVMSRISTLVTDIKSNLLMPSPFWGAQGGASMDDARIRKIYDEIDGMRMEGFLAALTDDVKVVFANHPPAVGKEQVRGAIGAFWSSIGGLRHRFTQILRENDQAAIEAQIDYTRKDGKVVTVPCVTMIRVRGDKVSEMRIHVDVGPVYAP